MSDAFSQKSLQKMKQKLQNNMPKISSAELKADKKSGLSKAIEAMSDEIAALKNQGLSFEQIAVELEKVGLKVKGGTIRKYVWNLKNSGAESVKTERVVSKPTVVATPVVEPAPVVAAPSVTPEPAPEPAHSATPAPAVETVAKVIIKPASPAPAQKHKAPVAGSKEFDELGFN